MPIPPSHVNNNASRDAILRGQTAALDTLSQKVEGLTSQVSLLVKAQMEGQQQQRRNTTQQENVEQVIEGISENFLQSVPTALVRVVLLV